jgi:hypothetical protein
MNDGLTTIIKLEREPIKSRDRTQVNLIRFGASVQLNVPLPFVNVTPSF